MTTVREHADDEYDRRSELARLQENWEQDAAALAIAARAFEAADDELRRCRNAETESRREFEEFAKPRALRPVDPFLDDEGHQARDHGAECNVCHRRQTFRARGICDECKEHEDRIGQAQHEAETA